MCVLALLYAGCGFRESRTTRVRFWNGFTGPDGRAMLRLVKRFNEQNPDIEVIMQRMDWATYYNKLFVAGIGERAPEVFVLHDYVMARFAEAGFVRPVDDLVAGPEPLPEEDFLAQAWHAAEHGGLHYGIPLDIHPLGLYYNKELFREAGIVDAGGAPSPPASREEFLDAARRMTRDTDGDGAPDQWGFVFSNFRTNVFTAMKQWGGRMFDDRGRPVLDGPENVAAAEFCAALVNDLGVAPPPQNLDSWIGFRQGRVGMVFEGIYMIADLEKQGDLDFGGAPVPQLGPVPATWAGSHNLCLRGDLGDKALAASWRFIRFLSDSSVDWARGGQVPARASLRATDRFQTMEVQAAFAEQLHCVTYIPKVPFIFEFYTSYDGALERILRGSASPEEALERARTELEGALKRRREMRERAGRATP